MARFAQLWAKGRRALARAGRERAPRVRLGVEGLETRVVPVILVNPSGTQFGDAVAPGHLRHAIINAAPVNEVIQIMQPGTYTLSLGGPGDANPASGDLDIIGKTNLLIEPGPGLAPCSVSIDAQYGDRIFDIAGSSSGVRIRGINLYNGAAWDSGYNLVEEGGAIRNSGSMQYIGCTIQGSAADRGGGIANLAGGLLNVNSNAVLDSNWAMTSGGGIYNRGNGVQLTNSFLSNNFAGTGGGVHSETSMVFTNSALRNNAASFGGGLYNTGSAPHTGTVYAGNWAFEGGGINTVGPTSSVSLVRSDLYYNGADRGGGVFSESSVLSTFESTIEGNYASREGGGVWAIAGRLRVEASTLAYNYAAVDGGGVWTGSNTVMLNSTVSTNYAGNFGGGIYYNAAPGFASLNMRHATVTQNWALTGGGLYSQLNGGPLGLLYNNIVAENWNYGGNLDDVFGSLDANGRNNLLSQLPGWGLTLGNNNQLGVVSPGLGVLQNNGGPTQTHALLSTSSALNAADPTFSLPTDQRGNARPAAAPDIGAFEL